MHPEEASGAPDAGHLPLWSTGLFRCTRRWPGLVCRQRGGSRHFNSPPGQDSDRKKERSENIDIRHRRHARLTQHW